MNEIDKILKQLDRITRPIHQVSNVMDKIIPPGIERPTAMTIPIVEDINRISKIFEPFLSQI